MAQAALAPLLERAPTNYTPLLLYGPHGSGKSHLACGLADWWRPYYPEALVQCLTAADFARNHAEALASGHLDKWRSELRAARLFVLEDLGELRGKRAAQQELLHVLDALADREALVVVTARSLPTHWPHLLAALRSRLSAGLAVPLVFPGRSTRRLILEHLASQRGLPMPKCALDTLADAIVGGVPAPIATIYELELAARADGKSVDAAGVQRLVHGRQQAAEPTLRQIAQATAKHFGLKLADLKSPGRQRALVTCAAWPCTWLGSRRLVAWRKLAGSLAIGTTQRHSTVAGAQRGC